MCRHDLVHEKPTTNVSGGPLKSFLLNGDTGTATVTAMELSALTPASIFDAKYESSISNNNNSNNESRIGKVLHLVQDQDDKSLDLNQEEVDDLLCPLDFQDSYSIAADSIFGNLVFDNEDDMNKNNNKEEDKERMMSSLSSINGLVIGPIPIDNTKMNIVSSLPIQESVHQAFQENPQDLTLVCNFLLKFPTNTTENNDKYAPQETLSSSYPSVVPSTSATNTTYGINKRKMTEQEESVPIVVAEPYSALSQQQPKMKKQRTEATTLSSSQEEEEKMSTTTPTFRKYQCEQWQERYQEICDFKKAHGHCNIPPSQEMLYRWLKRQRHQYKAKREGKASATITEERIQLLEEVGVIWDPQTSLWMERYSELCNFLHFNGHCNVPSRYPANAPLSTWVKCQRRQFKLFKEGKKSNITPERIVRLLNLGFVLEPRATTATK